METYEIVINTLAGKIDLSDNERDGIKRAFTSKGPYKGYLKKSMPKRDNTLARACWLALQPNVYKISIGAVFMLSDDERATHDKLNKYPMPAILDKDMSNLKQMGAW